MSLIAEMTKPPFAALTPTRGAEPLRYLRWAALGTKCEVQYVCADDVAAKSFEAAVVGWVAAFEAKYSRFRPDSLVSRINAAAGRDWVEVDAEMERFLDLCNSLHFMTRGLLDVTALPLMRLWDYKSASPRLPHVSEISAALRLVGWGKVKRAPGRVFLPEAGMALDFGGWGKEYAVDAVAEIASDHEIICALVDFGHDIHAIGKAPGKPGWHIGLEDPTRPGVACWGSIALANRSVASSGDYLRGFTVNGVRYGHIIDPRTGYPVAHGARQVTVIAPTCLQAGALSTTAFIMNPAEGVRFIQESMGAEGCILTANARYQTRGFLNYVVTQ